MPQPITEHVQIITHTIIIKNQYQNQLDPHSQVVHQPSIPTSIINPSRPQPIARDIRAISLGPTPERKLIRRSGTAICPP